MWLFTFFDLPTENIEQRKNYNVFRKILLKDGFTMMQFSIYIRHCQSLQNAEVHTKRIENNLPEFGKISILTITDKQFGYMKNFWGKQNAKAKSTPLQLELF